MHAPRPWSGSFIFKMPAGKKLSAAEKYMVVKKYEYILAKKVADATIWKGDVRKHVHGCLGFPTVTIPAI
jgi:hypothetical protein